MWISDGKFDESGTMGEYVHFLGPGGAWVDVPSGLGLEALAPGRKQADRGRRSCIVVAGPFEIRSCADLN